MPDAGRDGERRSGWGRGLAITLAVAIIAFVAAVVLLLVFDPRVNGAEAVRTGGLAGGAIIALYALWLNDRRRRVDEATHALESERMVVERFTRAVELLGHEADQVRVGALHALARLAHSRPGYTQTVLDVLCSYLRRPFDHPGRQPDSTPDRDLDADRELQARLTAQRLIADLLPRADDQGVFPDLDLTGAVLDYLDLSGRGTGDLTLRRARLYGTTRLTGTVVDGDAFFTGAVAHGMMEIVDARFHARCRFHYLVAEEPVSFERTHFQQGTALQDARFAKRLTMRECSVDKVLDLRNARFLDELDLTGAKIADVQRGAGLSMQDVRMLKLPASWTYLADRDGNVKLVDAVSKTGCE